MTLHMKPEPTRLVMQHIERGPTTRAYDIYAYGRVMVIDVEGEGDYHTLVSTPGLSERVYYTWIRDILDQVHVDHDTLMERLEERERERW